MPFATTQMKLEGIELSELNQRKTNVIRSHLCVKSKKLKTVDWWVPEAGNGGGKNDEGLQVTNFQLSN